MRTLYLFLMLLLGSVYCGYEYTGDMNGERYSKNLINNINVTPQQNEDSQFDFMHAGGKDPNSKFYRLHYFTVNYFDKNKEIEQKISCSTGRSLDTKATDMNKDKFEMYVKLNYPPRTFFIKVVPFAKSGLNNHLYMHIYRFFKFKFHQKSKDGYVIYKYFGPK